ncbi:hypothetical protein J1614_002574 [Plenodomus biglobosus]|nr:hypothetical protein J1614_002574 [Plenodomus biglobosus]
MAESPRVSLPNIAALPPTTAGQIGSGQVLVDPSSVVKELIDNALDARAKSIFIDITANTIDTIQVKDDGHGIPAEDRPLVCRRYCTSKIRDLQDLKEIGSKWLGFRGEALSSMAEMSSSLWVTTRVEGEPVAVKLKFQSNGELDKIERESHPVGTTVKVTGFFERMPVRKQTAIKHSSKWLAKVRHLLQAYAFARPAVRFRLHVLKAQSNKSDFIYAPSSNVSIEDAALKVIGKDCALQCDWTALEANGFAIHAFLPKPTANGSKVSSYGAFVSIDARPVSSLRGTTKQMVTAFKTRLRKISPSMACVKDPFMCVNIVCPPDSYDPNIEPAKDDVMFENGEVVLGAFKQLLNTYYPDTAVVIDINTLPTSVQQLQSSQAENLPNRMCTPVQDCDSDSSPLDRVSLSEFHEQTQWRSSMYGIDEDDLQFIQDEHPLNVEAEEGMRDAQVSNPWTIARMNASVKPRRSVVVHQLLSPAKSRRTDSPQSSPIAITTPRRDLPIDPLTPQSLSKLNSANQLVDELGKSITHMGSRSPGERMYGVENSNGPDPHRLRASGIPPLTNASLTRFNEHNHEGSGMAMSENDNINGAAKETHFPKSTAPHQSQGRQPRTYANKPFSVLVPASENSDTWFGQPMRGYGSQATSRQKMRPKVRDAVMCSRERRSSPRRHVLDAADHTMEDGLYSEDNTDIRDFFGRSSGPKHGTAPPGSFTPINHTSRAHLYHRKISEGPRDIGEQLRAYLERASPTRSSSAGATSMLLDAGDGQVYQHNHPSNVCMRSSSKGIEKQSQQPIMPPYPATATGQRLHEIRPEQAQGTEVHSTATHERKDPNASHHAHPAARRNMPHIIPPHENPTEPTRPRRRTTNGLERTKSSTLPLERIPHGSHTQNLILPIHITIATITHQSCNLDTHVNTLDWRYTTDNAFGIFAAAPASASSVTRWTARLDAMLHMRFGRVSGVDTMSLLHEGVQRGFDSKAQAMSKAISKAKAKPNRERESEKPSVEHAGSPGLAVGTGNGVAVEKDAGNANANAKLNGVGRVEGAENMDMSSFLDLNGTKVPVSVSVSVVEEDGMQNASDKSDEEFADDIDDDMLLDL